MFEKTTMKIHVILLLLLISANVLSQNQQDKIANTFSIKGIVIDSADNRPVEMAAATLYKVEDGSIVKAVATNSQGGFSITNIPPSSYNLRFTFLGYDTLRSYIPKESFNKSILVLDTIRLKTSGFVLSSVVITAEPPELVVKEDTLEYNAAAFKVAEGAVVEDLLKRLPGIEVDTEGKITKPDGKEVRRVFVDGKEFFGDDPKMATKNLTADIVDKVQVVDKKSDLALLTGVDDGDDETIINITIKKGMKQGWMGNFTSGIGRLSKDDVSKDLRYNENAMINRFLENDQISFIINANNINEQGSTDRGNNNRSRRGSNRNGIINSNTLGINTAKIISDKMKFGANVRYNYSDNFSENNRFRQNLLKDSTSYRRNISSDRDYSNNLEFDGKLEYKLDSLTTIVLNSSISYNYSRSHTESYQTTMAGDADSSKVNESTSANHLKSDGLNTRFQLNMSRKLSSKGRRMGFSATASFNNSTGDGVNNSENIYYLVPERNKTLDQQSHSDQDRNSYSFRFTYVEPMGRNNFLNFSYNIASNKTLNKKKTYDYDDLANDYTIFNPDYSKSSENNNLNQNVQLSFKSVRTNYTYDIGLTISPNRINSKSYIEDWYAEGGDSILNDIPGRSSVNYAPRLDFTYRLGNDKNARKSLQLRYNGRTNQPSANQLDPTPNNTNPLNIRSGNPDLLPSFNHNISFNYNDYNRIGQSSLNVSLTHSFTQNQIINYTTYEEKSGIQYTQPVNENGSWNSLLSALFSKPLDLKKRFKFSINTRLSYNNEVGFIKVDKQSQRNISKTMRMVESITLSYSNDWFYGQLRGSVNYSNTHNKISTNKDSGLETVNFNFSYNTQIILPSDWSISSDIGFSGSRGMSSGYNKDEIIWNAQINKQIFKYKQGSFRLQVTDILQQKLNIRRNVAASYIEDIQTNAMTGYIMLSFAYRFNSMGGRNRRRQNSDSNTLDYNEMENRGGGFGSRGRSRGNREF